MDNAPHYVGKLYYGGWERVKTAEHDLITLYNVILRQHAHIYIDAGGWRILIQEETGKCYPASIWHPEFIDAIMPLHLNQKLEP